MTRIIFLLLIALTTPAFADPSPDEVARAHYVAAQSYYKQGRAAEALREFEEAYRIAPRPAFHYNIAICHEKLGDDGLAIIAYQRYLAESPDADDRAAVEEHVAQLRARAMPPAAAPPALAAEPTPPGAAAPALIATAPAPARETPLWKRGWFWGVIGGGAALVITAVVVGVVVGGGSGSSPQTLPGVTLR